MAHCQRSALRWNEETALRRTVDVRLEGEGPRVECAERQQQQQRGKAKMTAQPKPRRVGAAEGRKPRGLDLNSSESVMKWLAEEE